MDPKLLGLNLDSVKRPRTSRALIGGADPIPGLWVKGLGTQTNIRRAFTLAHRDTHRLGLRAEWLEELTPSLPPWLEHHRPPQYRPAPTTTPVVAPLSRGPSAATSHRHLPRCLHLSVLKVCIHLSLSLRLSLSLKNTPWTSLDLGYGVDQDPRFLTKTTLSKVMDLSVTHR